MLPTSLKKHLFTCSQLYPAHKPQQYKLLLAFLYMFFLFFCLHTLPEFISKATNNHVACESSLSHPILTFFWWPLVAVVIIMAAMEEVRRSSIKSQVCIGRRSGWMVELNKHRISISFLTFIPYLK